MPIFRDSKRDNPSEMGMLGERGEGGMVCA